MNFGLPVGYASSAPLFDSFSPSGADMSSTNSYDRDSHLPVSTMSPAQLGLHNHHHQQQQHHSSLAGLAHHPAPHHHPHHSQQSHQHHHLGHPDPYASFVAPQIQPHHQQLSPTSARKRRLSDSSDPTGMRPPSSATSMSFPDSGPYSAGPGPAPGIMDPPPISPPIVKKTRTNTPWTPAEEQRLKVMRDAGNSWSEIAKSFPSRTEGSVKKHWYKDMHYAEFAEDEVRGSGDANADSNHLTSRQSAALLAAIKEYEASKWKVIGQKLGKPAKACEQYAKEHFGGKV